MASVGAWNGGKKALHPVEKGLDNPIGKSDKEFKKIIYTIQAKIKDLKEKLRRFAITYEPGTSVTWGKLLIFQKCLIIGYKL